MDNLQQQGTKSTKPRSGLNLVPIIEEGVFRCPECGEPYKPHEIPEGPCFICHMPLAEIDEETLEAFRKYLTELYQKGMINETTGLRKEVKDNEIPF